MEGLYKFASAFADIRPRWDDDMIDRANYMWTGVMLVLSALLVSAKQYVGDPINCFMDNADRRSERKFIENYCWVKNTYFYSPHHVLPQNNEYERQDREITYYQWVPFVLMIQALLFYLPCFCWRSFNARSGFDVRSIVGAAVSCELVEVGKRKSVVENLGTYMRQAIESQRELSTNCLVHARRYLSRYFLYCSRKYGNFLVGLYMCIKSLFVINSVGQLVILNEFLGRNHTLYGWEALKSMNSLDKDWEVSGRFPRITLCDFHVRVVGWPRQPHTVQCVLPINMFNEKIYVFLWFWFLLLSIMTITNLIYWLVFMFAPQRRFQFIKRHMKILQATKDFTFDQSDRHLLHKFVNVYLRTDGVFVLKLVSINASQMVTTEIIENLWVTYKGKFDLSCTHDEEDKNSSYSNKATIPKQQNGNLKQSLLPPPPPPQRPPPFQQEQSPV